MNVLEIIKIIIFKHQVKYIWQCAPEMNKQVNICITWCIKQTLWAVVSFISFKKVWIGMIAVLIISENARESKLLRNLQNLVEYVWLMNFKTNSLGDDWYDTLYRCAIVSWHEKLYNYLLKYLMVIHYFWHKMLQRSQTLGLAVLVKVALPSEDLSVRSSSPASSPVSCSPPPSLRLPLCSASSTRSRPRGPAGPPPTVTGFASPRLYHGLRIVFTNKKWQVINIHIQGTINAVPLFDLGKSKICPGQK